MTEAWKQLVGQVVNKEFHLHQYLGGSDHGAVFLTERGSPGSEKAAIKLIPADPENAEPQLFQWGVAAKLSHPHLIQLFRMGRCRLDNRDLLFVVMEYAEEDLSQILPQRPLTPSEARDMLQPVMSALAYVRDQGLAHGHLKPANIMASGDQLKISSDGMCAFGQPGERSRKTSIYQAPEVATEGMSPASDIWSLGVVLVEVMTQRPPAWDGHGDAVPPTSMPSPFLDIARNCLRRDPKSRYTITEIMGRLQGTLPVPTKPPVLAKTTGARSTEVSAQKRYVVAAVAAAFVLAAIVGGPRLFHHNADVQPNSSVAASQPVPAVAPDQAKHPARTEKPRLEAEAKRSAKIVRQEKQRASGVAPLPTSFEQQPVAKPLTGELVPGEVVQRVLPQVPDQARDTIHGTVRVAVRVHVDPAGNVVGAKFDSLGPSKYFAKLAMDAARRWKFDPPTVGGQETASEWVLRFEFTQSTTRVTPLRAAT